ncbi:hypothetical protein [Ornithinimicrobium kibberense]
MRRGRLARPGAAGLASPGTRKGPVRPWGRTGPSWCGRAQPQLRGISRIS